MCYTELPPRIRSWSPFSYGWICKSCPEVYVLDGSILKEDSYVFKSTEKQIRIEFFSAVYKKSFRDKKKPKNLDVTLDTQIPAELEVSSDKKKLEKYVESVIRETSITRILEPLVDAPEDKISPITYEE